MPAARAGLAGGKKATDIMNSLALDRSDILKDRNKLRASQVGHLLAPQLDHALEVEVFHEDVVKSVGQVVSEFEEPVGALIGECGSLEDAFAVLDAIS